MRRAGKNMCKYECLFFRLDPINSRSCIRLTVPYLVWMAKQLRLLFLGSVIVAIVIFCYINFWKGFNYGSIDARLANSSFDTTAVYSQNVDIHSVLEDSYELTVKKVRARTRELIAEKVKNMSDTSRHQQHSEHLVNPTFDDFATHPKHLKTSIPETKHVELTHPDEKYFEPAHPEPKSVTPKLHTFPFHHALDATDRKFNYVTPRRRPSESYQPVPKSVTPKPRKSPFNRDLYTPVHREDLRYTPTLTAADLPTITVRDANCTALFRGDETELSKANQFQSENEKRSVEPMMLVRQASNCTRFRVKRRYAMLPVNEEEEDFPIAFSILVFKDVEQFERLLRAIYRPQNLYCIHVDNKSASDIHAAVNSIARCFDNVFVLQKPVDVHWGYFSVLEPELKCMKRLLRRSKKWKYFINLTGQEFPLKTNWQIVRILKAFNGSNNMEGTVERFVLCE